LSLLVSPCASRDPAALGRARESEKILFAQAVSLLYQFWIHTEAIERLPAPLEWLLNTPSHHRVHHGKNVAYLDRNHGGVLIVWDRLFGTFEAEDERTPARMIHTTASPPAG
jgi:sterol desaturase/sphingolipid hydroxylase (fatty acid hydroxylase superfamily)